MNTLTYRIHFHNHSQISQTTEVESAKLNKITKVGRVTYLAGCVASLPKRSNVKTHSKYLTVITFKTPDIHKRKTEYFVDSYRWDCFHK